MFARYVWIIAFVFLGGCGGGVSILPEPFTRERADGKIPVKVELIREQVRKELDGMPEGEAEVLRWQAIEKDYNECRLSSAESSKQKAEEVFAVCMSQRDYVYMLPIDAEQFHNDIFFAMRKEKEESERLAEERRIVAEKKREEERIAAEKRREKERKESERRAEERRIAAEKAEKEKQYNGALFAAASVGNVENVRKFLSLGASPNAVNDSGIPAFNEAAWNGHADIVKILLAAGADMRPTTKLRETALMDAARRGHVKIVKILLAAGANPNAVSNKGYSALTFATIERKVESVNVLLSAGADPNMAGPTGRSVMELIGLFLFAEFMFDQIDEKNDTLAEENGGWRPLIIASLGGDTEIVKVLLENGANPNAADSKGWTSLMFAAWVGHAEIVKMLLTASDDMTHGTRYIIIRALILAKKRGNSDVVRILEEAAR